jgi:hypothetical protein
MIKIAGKYGFINKMNTVSINCEFDNAYSFIDGITRVKVNEKWGYINKEGVQFWED